MADNRISNRNADVPFPVARGYEDKIEKRLRSRSNLSIRRAFRSFLSKVSKGNSPEAAKAAGKADARRLALFLYDVVYCRQTQQEKIDPFIESLTGIQADTFEYAPKAIERFCKWVKPYIDFEKGSVPHQCFENILPQLHGLARSISSTKKKMARWRASSSKAEYDLVIFMERKTGVKRFSDLAIFLNETAKLFGMNQRYSQKSLRDSFRNYLKRRT